MAWHLVYMCRVRYTWRDTGYVLCHLDGHVCEVLGRMTEDVLYTAWLLVLIRKKQFSSLPYFLHHVCSYIGIFFHTKNAPMILFGLNVIFWGLTKVWRVPFSFSDPAPWLSTLHGVHAVRAGIRQFTTLQLRDLHACHCFYRLRDRPGSYTSNCRK